MWLLRHDGKGLVYRLTPGKQHIISRKEGDLLLQDDQSISRKHAQLFVDDENVNEGVKLKDLESKYGTFTRIGDGQLSRLAANEEVVLGSGDFVRFGIQWNNWRLEFVPLLVATSTLMQEEKAEVRQMVTELGGALVKDWQRDCTHLTMNKLTVTVKVVCALAAGQPIVTPAYWRSLTLALSTLQTTLPDCASHQPPLAEATLNPAEVSFSPRPERSVMFKGHTFVASTAKQMARIRPMITAAGGKVDQFCQAAWPEEKLVDSNVILMQHSMHEKTGSQHSQVPDGFITITRRLKLLGLRTVPESEIGLSVLHCSMDQFCNPRYDVRVMLSSSSSLEPTQPVNVLCPNTEVSSECQDLEDALTEPNTFNKRANEINIEDDNMPVSKKRNTRQNSEDLFKTQLASNTTPGNNSSRTRLSLRKDTSPSNDCNISKTNPPQSTSPVAGPSNSAKEKQSNMMPVQSLDMFAPSGNRTKHVQAEDIDVVRPSCEDLFGSNENRKTQSGKTEDNDEFAFKRNKRPIMQQENGQDELFFKKRKVNKEIQMSSNDEDVFSFSNKKAARNPQPHMEQNQDEFSFTSKSSRKRNRQSNSDMFASSHRSSVNISVAGTSKIAGVNNDNSKENMFSFTSDRMSKRRRVNDVPELDEMGSEIKIAMFSKGISSESDSSVRQTDSEPQHEQQTEVNNLVTYSKTIPVPVKIKQDVNEEVDALAKEFQNATVVVVKSLLKPRQTPPPEKETPGTGKNFKKFRKVMPLNKRVVPHIIGGNDLVPHNQLYDPPMDDSPQRQETPVVDDWGFTRNRHKGRSH